MSALQQFFDSGSALPSMVVAITFLQVIAIDLVLAGDNAVVIGMAASGLRAEQRNRAILIGIAAATVLRIAFASVAVWLLAIIGLLLAGGVLLLWVCWKMWRELRNSAESEAGHAHSDKTMRQAITQIVVADVSMSLDNVLAVAGAARHHPFILVVGLVVSIALMGASARLIANLLNKHRWIAYVGFAIILYVALRMVWDGSVEVIGHIEREVA